jgi:hypothetical protein
MAESRMINHPCIPTTRLARPVPFLPNGRGPLVHDVPAVAGGPMGAAVVTELKERARKPADNRNKGAKP